MEFGELERQLVEFRDARGWGKYHTPKNLAISAAVELGELLEHFQWESDGEILKAVKDPTKKEAIADVIIYLTLLAHELGIDLDEAVEKKIKKNGEKYPAEATVD